MWLSVFIGGPLDMKLIELQEPHAYELFRMQELEKDDHECWAYYRVHPLDSDKLGKKPEQSTEASSKASRVIAERPKYFTKIGGRSKRNLSYRRPDLRYLFVRILDENARAVLARKALLKKEV